MPKLSEPAAAIVKARHEASMFYEMGERNLLLSAQLILADLKLLSGLKIPTGNGFERMSQLFAESLKQDYPFYTVPLIQIAIKKYVNVLTTGEEKSYGRDLSIADFHQVMNEYSLEVQNANKEVDELLQKESAEKILAEEDKQNIIRSSIQEQYERNDFECCYADFNQLMRDGLLSETSLHRNAWKAIKSLKEKYIQLSKNITEAADPENINAVIHKKNYSDKIAMITEMEDAIKAETASLFLKWNKENNVEKIYQLL